MERFVASVLKNLAQPGWELGIDEKLHPRTRCWLLRWSARAANSRQAKKSSRSKSGNSDKRSSMLSPAARCSNMDSTGYRRPRMTGFPWQISGLIVMRESNWLMCRLSTTQTEPRLSAEKRLMGNVNEMDVSVNSGLCDYILRTSWFNRNSGARREAPFWI